MIGLLSSRRLMARAVRSLLSHIAENHCGTQPAVLYRQYAMLLADIEIYRLLNALRRQVNTGFYYLAFQVSSMASLSN